jgi:competence protein ComEC
VARLADGRPVAVDLDAAAFAEDCLRAAIVVTPLFAPTGCAAPVVLDRDSLRLTGAVTLKIEQGSQRFTTNTVRAPDEDRPWSPAPKPHRAFHPESESGDKSDPPRDDP